MIVNLKNNAAIGTASMSDNACALALQGTDVGPDGTWLFTTDMIHVSVARFAIDGSSDLTAYIGDMSSCKGPCGCS